jgi:hypothetical protein
MPRQTALSAFSSLAEIAGVFAATKGGLRCTAIKLQDGGVCLFSPVAGLSAEARNSLELIGKVTHLFAPNHYHNRGLAEYSSIFPDAMLCASSKAAPRLEQVTGLAFSDLSDLAPRLPAQTSLLEPDGLKTGEIWVRAKTGKLTAWFVVDAIAGPKTSGGETRSDHPELLKTFPHFGVRNKTAYAGWFETQLRIDHPRLVVPCHGGIVAAGDLPQKLQRLVREAFS